MSPSMMSQAVPIGLVNDSTLSDRVRAFLGLRGLLSGQVKVSEHEGTIVLEGTVGLYHDRQVAISCAKHVAGVRRIVDRIIVAPQGPSAAGMNDR